MKVPIRMPVNKSIDGEEKRDYGNYSNTRIITLFQVPQYEYLQILICNGNSLTTLAGVEHIKHLWKLDVGNNQIRSLQHLSRFIALGSLILTNNRLQWIELQHIRHMFVLDLRLHGNPTLENDANYRQHVLDCLPRIWMCDGVFITTAERNQVDEFFTQSSLTIKPVRRKLARDTFMPTNLKDRSVHGLFGKKATDLFAKFPLNCFVNSELDKRRVKHLASTIEDFFLIEMRHDDRKQQDDFLLDNRHVLHHMIDMRQNHVEEYNMFLLLLLADLLFEIPLDLLNNILDITHIRTIGNINIEQIFSSSEELRRMIASLIHAGARLDRDESHPSAFYEKLLHHLSILINNQIRLLSNTNQPYPNNSTVSEAKSMICLEIMQVLIMCPKFYTLADHPNVQAIVKQALEHSPAYGTIKDVLDNLKADEKSAEEQRDFLSPVLGNILKMTIRTLSNKRTKKLPELLPQDNEKRSSEASTSSPKPPTRINLTHSPTIGDRILTAPQTFGRIITMPDADTAMIQLDHILAVNGSMITHGSLNDHTHYVNMNHFEWDALHEYWKPKYALGDRITLHMTTIKEETPRSATFSTVPRTIPAKMPETGRTAPKLFEMNLNKPKEAFVEPPPASISDPEEPPTVDEKPITPDDIVVEHPLSIRISKQNSEFHSNENLASPPVLIESTLLLLPDQSQAYMPSSDQQPFHTFTLSNDLDQTSTSYRRGTATHRVPVPIQNAAQWFSGPDMQNERSGRMEKVVSSILRRSVRPMSHYTMPRVPILTSPSSKDHAQSKGVRPGTLQDFCIESQRINPPPPFMFTRSSQSAKDRYGSSNPRRSHLKNVFNLPCPTPAWM